MTLDNANNAMGKIEFTTDVDALRDVDFIVEAVVENIDLKKDLYTTLGKICRPETIFASNTSSLSIGGKCVYTYYCLLRKEIIFIHLYELCYNCPWW